MPTTEADWSQMFYKVIIMIKSNQGTTKCYVITFTWLMLMNHFRCHASEWKINFFFLFKFLLYGLQRMEKTSGKSTDWYFIHKDNQGWSSKLKKWMNLVTTVHLITKEQQCFIKLPERWYQRNGNKPCRIMNISTRLHCAS